MRDCGMCMVDCTAAVFFPHPTTHEQDFVGPRGKTVSERVIRLKNKRTLNKRETLRRTWRHAGLDFGKRSQNEVVGIETFRPLTLNVLDLCGA